MVLYYYPVTMDLELSVAWQQRGCVVWNLDAAPSRTLNALYAKRPLVVEKRSYNTT